VKSSSAKSAMEEIVLAIQRRLVELLTFIRAKQILA